MMKHANNYEYIYAHVVAIQMSKQSQSEVIELLMTDVAEGKMAKLDIRTNKDGAYVVVFRYKTDTVEQVLDPEEGTWLVVRKDDTKVAMTADDFADKYFLADVLPVVGLARAGVAVLGRK